MNQTYQLKIELKDSNPKIWRRIQIPGNTSFSDLHDIIQLSMGWEDQHMYEFLINGIRIYDFEGAIDDGSDPSERDTMDTFLDEIVTKPKTGFSYIYDFGNYWEHEIAVEKIIPEEKDKAYPLCLDGKRACPPEDCGGIWGYGEMLEILFDKDHPEYEETLTWIGGAWDADFFDCNQTNFLLKDYAEQWEEIYEETGEIIESLEKNNGDIDDWDYDEESKFEELKKFSNPQDVLLDEYERSDMEDWILNELDDRKSKEYQTFERLRDLGFAEKKTHDLILDAFAIERFYKLKYGIDHLEDRYEYNLGQLPETPQEIPDLKTALDILNSCSKGVPFSAIEYLQNDSSAEATAAIVDALKNHSDHQYCWEDCFLAPFWYALAAECHLCEELIDPVIRIYEENSNESDWLNEQGQFLIGKLAEKYPDLTAQGVLEAMERDAKKRSKSQVFFLFDAFYFCDIEKYKSRLLALLKRDDLYWNDILATTFADLQIKEGLPILKDNLKKLKALPGLSDLLQDAAVEIEEAIKILEGELIQDPEDIMPFSLARKSSWKDELKKNEEVFYPNQDPTDEFDFSSSFEEDLEVPTKMRSITPVVPLIKEKTPGRNDPCHCGSGKKYKKCCMDKDSKIF